jgi:hypothetical protein
MGLVIAYIHSVTTSLSQLSDGTEDGEKDGEEKEASEEREKNPDVTAEEGDEEEKEEAEEEMDSKNIAQLTRVRDALLDLLIERTHDVSPFTRAAVLKVGC